MQNKCQGKTMNDTKLLYIFTGILVGILLLYSMAWFNDELSWGNIPNTPQYAMRHQCDAQPEGIGDPYCVNYKDENGDWFSVEVSRQIAINSGSDMNRFEDYHKKVG